MDEGDRFGEAAAVAFGPFRLLPGAGLLLNGDTECRLGSRALDILICLVEHAGETVTKRDLLARAWPDTFVHEANLRVHIAALRKVLGDGQGGARYLVNVMGRGYCFVAPVRSIEPPPVAAPTTRLTNLRRRSRRSSGVSSRSPRSRCRFRPADA